MVGMNWQHLAEHVYLALLSQHSYSHWGYTWNRTIKLKGMET